MSSNLAVIELATMPTNQARRIPAKLANALEETGADRYLARPYMEQPHKIQVTLLMPKRLGSGIVSSEIINTNTGTFA